MIIMQKLLIIVLMIVLIKNKIEEKIMNIM